MNTTQDKQKIIKILCFVAFVNFVANEVDLFHEGAMQSDDITIVTLRKLS